MSRTSPNFKERIRHKLQIEKPELEGEALESEIQKIWESWRTQKEPPKDAFLTGKGFPVVRLDDSLIQEQNLNWGDIAQDFIKINPLWYDRAGLWWVWHHIRRCYELADETDILNMVDYAVKRKNYRTKAKTELLEAFRREARKTEPQEAPKTWVQFDRVIYDVKQGKPGVLSPKYFITNPVPWAIGETKETPVIDRLLSEWCPENWLTLKQLMAYCCLPDYPLHRIFVLHGSGLNGKGSFLRMLTTFLGQENCASTELDLLLRNQFQVSKLHRKLLCQMGETNFSEVKNTSLLKRLSGQDLIGFEFKNKKPFDDYNNAKIVIATNSLPITHDRTDGFYRRFIIIDFPIRFTEKKDVLAEVPEKEYNCLAAWCIKELKRLLTERSFHNEGTIEERKERYEARSDTLEQFIGCFAIKDANGVISANEFYNKYILFLTEHGHRKLTYGETRAGMKKKGYEYTKKRLDGFENPVSVILGLRFVPAVPNVPLPSLSPYAIKGEQDIVEQTEQLEQYKKEEGLLPKIRTFLQEKNKGAGVTIDYLQQKFPEVTDEKIEFWKEQGEIMELPPGWLKPV